MTDIYTVAVQKGGTGKTATAAMLAQAAAYRGMKALALDLDPQGNLSFELAADTRQGSTFNLLAGTPAKELIQHTRQGLDIIPAAWSLATEQTARGSARRLEEALKPIKRQYDIIIIDTPPTAGELQYNALQAATGLIIPLMADIHSLQALYQIVDTAREISKTNKTLEITGIVITQLDRRSTLAKQMQQMIIDRAEKLGIPYLGAIRNGIAVKEAAALQQSLFEYAPKSKPAADYLDLFDKIIK